MVNSLDEMRRLRREITRSLWLRGRPPLELSTSAEELLYLATTARRVAARQIAEIGFNAGFSAQAFLSAVPDAEVVSFDLVAHGYTRTAKKLLDARFPGRHTLIAGDSTRTVVEYARGNPGARFDLVFIDGGHDYEVARADLWNMRALSTGATVVIMDDLAPWLRWGVGPTRAWTEAVREGVVRQEELFNEGRAVTVIEPPGRRVWAMGRYLITG